MYNENETSQAKVKRLNDLLESIGQDHIIRLVLIDGILILERTTINKFGKEVTVTLRERLTDNGMCLYIDGLIDGLEYFRP